MIPDKQLEVIGLPLFRIPDRAEGVGRGTSCGGCGGEVPHKSGDLGAGNGTANKFMVGSLIELRLLMKLSIHQSAEKQEPHRCPIRMGTDAHPYLSSNQYRLTIT